MFNHTPQTGMSVNRKNTDYSKFTNGKCDREFARYGRFKSNKFIFIAGVKLIRDCFQVGDHKNVRFMYIHMRTKFNLLNLNIFQNKSSVRYGLHVTK